MTARQIPAVGVGTAAFGRLYEPVSTRQAIATLARAHELGIDYVDTAPGYGEGLSEHRVGEHLARSGERPFVSSKVGTLVDELPPLDLRDLDAVTMAHGKVRRAWSVEAVRRSVHDSLARLGLPALDLALLHDPESHEDEAATSGYEALRQLQDEGLVGAIGVGCNHVDVAARLIARLDLDYVLLAGRYTLLDQSALETVLPLALDRGTKIIAAGVFNSGILATGEPTGPYTYRPATPEIGERVRRLSDVCARHGVPISAAAAQLPRAHPAVCTTLLGVRSPAEVEANVAALRHVVPAALWDDLRTGGLLGDGVPVPSPSAPPDPSRAIRS